jgi:hypothetical protein
MKLDTDIDQMTCSACSQAIPLGAYRVILGKGASWLAYCAQCFYARRLRDGAGPRNHPAQGKSLK